MSKEIIIYKDKVNVKTKDTLRSISLADQNWIKTVMMAYTVLEYRDSRPDLKVWFNRPNTLLPKHDAREKYRHNSPKEWCEGIIKKLEQAPNGRDLSPRQCSGIEELTRLMAGLYNDEIPNIVFVKQGQQSPKIESFTKLFKDTV
jgi:hypothetical protein